MFFSSTGDARVPCHADATLRGRACSKKQFASARIAMRLGMSTRRLGAGLIVSTRPFRAGPLAPPSGIVSRRRLGGFFDGLRRTGSRNRRRRRGNGRRRRCDRRGLRGGCFGGGRRSRGRGRRTGARSRGGIRRRRFAPEPGEPRNGEEEKKPAAQRRQPKRGLRFFGDRLVVGVGGRRMGVFVFGVRCVVVRGSVAHVSAPWRAIG